MTNLITLTIPNDDHIALRAFGKALEEMALAHGAEPVGELTYKLDIDTTAQQLESFARNQQPLGNEIESAIKENLHELYLSDTGSVTDSTGTPWDERIHSASKALNADGTWRLRRKPKDMNEEEWSALVESVKDELNECLEVPPEAYLTDDFVKPPVTLEDAVNASIEAVTPVMTDEEVKAFDDVEPPVTPPGDDFHTDAGVVSEQTIAGIPPIPVPPPVTTATLEMNLPTPPHTIPVTAQVVDDWTFPKLMTFLTERQGKIDVATVNMLLAQDGIASLPELNAHPDKIGPFVARVKAHLGE